MIERLFTLAAAILIVAACQSHMPEKQPESATREIAEESIGSLEGLVKLAGEDEPETTQIQNTTDPEVCGRDHTLDDMIISRENRGIRNVIVALAEVPEEKIPSLLPGHLVVDNTACRFTPHVSVLTVGSTIEAINSDPVLHTTHFYGAIEANISLPVQGATSTRVVHRPGMVIIKCDIHGWMQGFIRVDPHPFHAVTVDDGSFQISDIPDGTYTLEVWHEKLGLQRKTVHIQSGKTEHIEIQYSFSSN
jgi:plastocyanin